MRKTLVVVPVSLAFAIVAACVGSDPTTASIPSVLDAALVADAAPVYGIFLTSKLYRTDFLANANVDASALHAVVDQECIDAATRAGLPGPERYSAIIAAEPEASNGDEKNATVLALEAPSGMWCPVTRVGGDAQVDCVASPPIFASPASFERGPDGTLIRDENGLAEQSNSLGQFLSGLVIDAGATSAVASRVRNCLAWSAPAVLDALDAHVDASQAQAGFGSVTLQTPPLGGYLWLVSSVQPCDGTERPILCLQHPAVPGGDL